MTSQMGIVAPNGGVHVTTAILGLKHGVKKALPSTSYDVNVVSFSVQNMTVEFNCVSAWHFAAHGLCQSN